MTREHVEPIELLTDLSQRVYGANGSFAVWPNAEFPERGKHLIVCAELSPWRDWYAGLGSVAQHVCEVRSKVRVGGKVMRVACFYFGPSGYRFRLLFSRLGAVRTCARYPRKGFAPLAPLKQVTLEFIP